MSCNIPEHIAFGEILAGLRSELAGLRSEFAAKLEEQSAKVEEQGAKLEEQGAKLEDFVLMSRRIALRQALSDAETLLLELLYESKEPLGPFFFATRHIFSIDDAFRWVTFHSDRKECAAIAAAAEAANAVAESVAPAAGRARVRKAALGAAHPADLQGLPTGALESYAESAYSVVVPGGTATSEDGLKAVRLYRHAQWLAETLAAGGGAGGRATLRFATIDRIHRSKLHEYAVADSRSLRTAESPGSGSGAAPPFKDTGELPGAEPTRQKKRQAFSKSVAGAAEVPPKPTAASSAAVPSPAKVNKTDAEKRLKKLAKKLKEIEELEGFAAAGVSLNADQLAKVASGAETRAALAVL